MKLRLNRRMLAVVHAALLLVSEMIFRGKSKQLQKAIWSPGMCLIGISMSKLMNFGL